MVQGRKDVVSGGEGERLKSHDPQQGSLCGGVGDPALLWGGKHARWAKCSHAETLTSTKHDTQARPDLDNNASKLHVKYPEPYSQNILRLKVAPKK